jgi:hypothetical protein
MNQHFGKRRRPRLEPKEQFEARLQRNRQRLLNPQLAHEDLVRGLERIVEAHERRRQRQHQDEDDPLA